MTTSSKILQRNHFVYDYFLKRKILEEKEDLAGEELVKRIRFLAKFAWLNHAGYYADGRVENILFDFGRDIGRYVDRDRVDKKFAPLFSKERNYSVIHVATELYNVGGHTRLLYQFLKRYEDQRQVVVLTDQNIGNVPEWFVNGIGNISIVTFDDTSCLFERAYILRRFSSASERVFLYHHPHDVIPVIAFADENCPPVVVHNHSHSWFWLGPSIADAVLVPTDFHKEFTLRTRPLKNVHCIPFTQIDDIGVFIEKSKAEAREKLNIAPTAFCIITIGTPGKFIPNSHYNFYLTAQKIVERFENVELFVIGIHPHPKYNFDSHRIHFLGPVSDPDDYYKAADICLDALPQPSLGGTLFATLIGMACPLFKYGVSSIFNAKNFMELKVYEEYIGNVTNERQYLDKLEFLINRPDIRIKIASELREKFVKMISKDSISGSIQEMLNLTDNKRHVSGRIPKGVYFNDADSAEIAETCSLQDLSATIQYFDEYFNIKDKISVIAHLSVSLIHCPDILKLAQTLLINRIKNLFYLFRGRRLL